MSLGCDGLVPEACESGAVARSIGGRRPSSHRWFWRASARNKSRSNARDEFDSGRHGISGARDRTPGTLDGSSLRRFGHSLREVPPEDDGGVDPDRDLLAILLQEPVPQAGVRLPEIALEQVP